MNHEIRKAMVAQFQCSGCTCGHEPDTCKSADIREVQGCNACYGWSAGTFMSPGGAIAIGLPKGFNRMGQAKSAQWEASEHKQDFIYIRLWESPTHFTEHFTGYNRFNVPVWALEQDGFLFVRCYMPRTNFTVVDVIKDGKRADLCPNAMNVADFSAEMD
jgi:hypothetical protein